MSGTIYTVWTLAIIVYGTAIAMCINYFVGSAEIYMTGFYIIVVGVLTAFVITMISVLRHISEH